MNQSPPLIESKNDNYFLIPDTVFKAKGKFGILCKAMAQRSKQMVVARIVLLKNIDERSWERYKREIGMQDLPEGFSATVDFARSNERLIIFRRFFEGVSLAKLPQPKWYQFKSKPLNPIILFYSKVALMLHQLHLKGFLHNDIRPSNIIVQQSGSEKFSWNNNPSPAIIDLGLAISLAEINNLKQLPYALTYSPPELVLEHYPLLSPAADVYALAVTMFEVISGETPFQSEHPELSIQLQINLPLPKDDDVPEVLYNVLNKASSKFAFPKPPNLYPKLQVEEHLKKSIENRYQTAEDFAQALLKLLQ
jgi:serine/threonine protein kinase